MLRVSLFIDKRLFYWAYQRGSSIFSWDCYHAIHNIITPHMLYLVCFIRLTGTVILVTAWISLKRGRLHNEKIANYVLSCTVTACYALVLCMILVLPFPTNYLIYFTGLPLVISFVFGLLRLRARPVFTILFFLFVASAVGLYYASDINTSDLFYHNIFPPSPTEQISVLSGHDIESHYTHTAQFYYASNMFYLASFSIVGCVVAAELERTARNAFLREKQLEDGNATLTELNGHLKQSERDVQSTSAALIAVKDQMRELAEKRNLDKSKFLADATHDLAQPLQALTSLLRLQTQSAP